VTGYIILTLICSLLAFVMAFTALVFSIITKVFYIDKLLTPVIKIDPYEKYRTSDGLLSGKSKEGRKP
jgi:hypothetical protein